MKILHVGLGDCSNIGDQAITDCLSKLLNCSSDIEYDFYKLNYTSSNIQGREGGVPSSKGLKDRLRRIKWIKSIYELILPFVMWRYYLKLYALAKKNDRVLIGGGNVLMDVDLLFPWHLFIISIICKLAGSSSMLFVAGVGPLNTWSGRWLARRFAHNLSGAVVRDERSKKILLDFEPSMKVSVLPDPVFYGREILRISNHILDSKKTFKILVSVFPYGSGRVSHKESGNGEVLYLGVIQELLSELNSFLNVNPEVDILVTDSNRDYDIARKLSEKINGNILVPHSSELLLEMVADADFVIATRMHAAIAASTMGTPFMALSWQEKFSSCFDVVELKSRVFAIDKLVEGEGETGIDFEKLMTVPVINMDKKQYTDLLLGGVL